MTKLRWAFKPDEWDSLSPEDKVLNIFKRMDAIHKYNKNKFWRSRYASSEQIEREYPKDDETILAVAFIKIKEEFDPHIIPTMELTDNQENYVKWLNDFIDQDVERVLLEDEVDD